MSNSSMLENGRAKFAYDYAEGAVKKFGEKDKEYKSNVKKIPMMIKTNGLGATLAFIKAKGKDGNAYCLIYTQAKEWLKQKFPEIGDKDLVDYIISNDSNQYRALTIETLAFFNWLRRFAEGLFKGDD